MVTKLQYLPPERWGRRLEALFRISAASYIHTGVVLLKDHSSRRERKKCVKFERVVQTARNTGGTADKIIRPIAVMLWDFLVVIVVINIL